MAGVEQEPESANLAAWRIGLEQIPMRQEDRGFETPFHAFARQLAEVADPYAAATGLGLPVPYYKKFNSPGEFVDDTEGALEPFRDLGITNLYVGLRPTQPGLEKFRNDVVPLSYDEVAPFITDRISPDQYGAYSLRVAEFAVGVFGAVIVINPSGFQHIDIGFGDVGPIATGHKRPEYEARTDNLDMLRYFRVRPELRGNPSVTTDFFRQLRRHRVISEQVRGEIGGIIQRIPQVDPHNESARAPRLPGRYEVVLVRRADKNSGGSKLVALCVDAQPDIGTAHPYAVPEEPLYWGDGRRAN